MPTTLEIARPDRWDNPFGNDLSSTDVERILELPSFRDIDSAAFPSNLTLRDIIRNDARVLEFAPGEVILRRGDYGSSLFIVVTGSVRAIEGAIDAEIVHGRSDRNTKARVGNPLLWALKTLCHKSGAPERRDLKTPKAKIGHGSSPTNGQAGRPALEDFESIIAQSPTIQLSAGEMFGESAALSRSPHTATVFADSNVLLVELRWQGLRDIRHWDLGFHNRLDQIYRAQGLKAHLRQSPLFVDVDEETLEIIARQTLFESLGEVDWASGYKRVLTKDVNEVIDSEPEIASQDGYVDGMFLIRMGFGRITERLDKGHRTVGFLSQNEVFGLEEIVDHWNGEGDLTYRNGLRAVGYVDVLRIPTALVEEHLLPLLYPKRKKTRRRGNKDHSHALDESMLNFLVNNRTINGTAVMAIDTDRCTGCDECVRACAAAHDNNPRFVRQGQEHANVMIASACMHCVDPLCLIGCPTAAIHRTTEGGLVVIDDAACIGCSICANSCPYDNIRMVEIRNGKGELVVDDATHAPILKATKCDLCIGQSGGPACQRACPHDALVRIDACDREGLAKWINR